MSNGSERIAEYPGRQGYTALIEEARTAVFRLHPLGPSPMDERVLALAEAVEALVAENEYCTPDPGTIDWPLTEAVIEKVRADAEDSDLNIPDDVLREAASVLFAARYGAVPQDIEGDKDFEWAVEDLGTAAPIIARWAREEALKEAAQRVRDYWDACGELIDSNNGARLAFEAVAARVEEDA